MFNVFCLHPFLLMFAFHFPVLNVYKRNIIEIPRDIERWEKSSTDFLSRVSLFIYEIFTRKLIFLHLNRRGREISGHRNNVKVWKIADKKQKKYEITSAIEIQLFKYASRFNYTGRNVDSLFPCKCHRSSEVI